MESQALSVRYNNTSAETKIVATPEMLQRHFIMWKTNFGPFVFPEIEWKC